MTKHGGGIGAPTREERMKEAASLHIKTGNIQRYCELMVEMGQVILMPITLKKFSWHITLRLSIHLSVHQSLILYYQLKD